MLREKLFGDGSSDVLLGESDTAKELSKHAELSEQILREIEEIKKTRSDLTMLRRERAQTQQQTRELMKSIQVRRGAGGRKGEQGERITSPTRGDRFVKLP